MHGENLELSLKDREPVNVYVTILFLKDSIRVITYRQSDCPLNGGVLLSTWRQGRAHCTTWEELSHHRELVPSPPHESSLYSASWYKILFFLRNYNQLVVNHLWQCCSNCFMIGSHPKVLKKHQVVLAWVGDQSCDWRNLGNVTFSFIAIKIRLW